MEIHQHARCRMNRTKKLIMTLLPVVVLGLGTTAQAQDTPPPSDHHRLPRPPRTTREQLERRRRHSASARPSRSASGFPAATSSTTWRLFHIEGLLGFNSNPPGLAWRPQQRPGCSARAAGTTSTRAPRATCRSGGVVAINYTSQRRGSDTLTAIEPGINARAFLTPNFAIFFRGGLAIVLGNDDGAAASPSAASPSWSAASRYFFR